MNKIDRYLDSLLDLPPWIGLPIFLVSLVIPLFCTIFIFLLMVMSISSWFLLIPVVIWAACAINWWLKNKDK